MDVLLFGATGMVGQGVLRECLLDAEVRRVVAIGRSATGQAHSKFREVIHRDFLDFSTIENELAGFDACFFCLGVTSAGMSEEKYRRVTYGFTLAAADVVASLNPGITFLYVSGIGADSTERGRIMWARVRGETENALLRLPFRGYVFRPAAVVGKHGIRSKTRLYRWLYAVMRPVLPWMQSRMPNYVTTTEQMGLAMLKVARYGAPKRILENQDINAL